MMPTKRFSRSWDEHKRKRKKRSEKLLLNKVQQVDVKKNSEEARDNINQLKINDKKRFSSLSIAVPGSILDNAQSPELRSYLAGQIARAACIYKVDEVIVYDDKGDIKENEKKKVRNDDTLGERRVSCLQLARILQYLECPQYLRKYFFPLHKDLQYAGLLNPLDAPHHLRQQDVSVFREGVVTKKPIKAGKGSQVNVGLANDAHVDKVLTPGLRVTVKLLEQKNTKNLSGIAVSPNMPRSEAGIYWGYAVRLASNITEIFTKCPYAGGYDFSIGTSDKGTSIDNVPPCSLSYDHALIVFGGLLGLEAATELDPNLDIDDPALLFDQYLNTCPEQGSRTIRTEEAILISLAELRKKLVPSHPPLMNQQS